MIGHSTHLSPYGSRCQQHTPHRRQGEYSTSRPLYPDITQPWSAGEGEGVDEGTEAGGKGVEGGLKVGKVCWEVGLGQGFELVPTGIPAADLEFGAEDVHLGTVGIGGFSDAAGQTENVAGLGTHAGLPLRQVGA